MPPCSRGSQGPITGAMLLAPVCVGSSRRRAGSVHRRWRRRPDRLSDAGAISLVAGNPRCLGGKPITRYHASPAEWSDSARRGQQRCRRTGRQAPTRRNPQGRDADPPRDAEDIQGCPRIAKSPRRPTWPPGSTRTPPLRSRRSRHRPRNAQAGRESRFSPCLAPATGTEKPVWRRNTRSGNEATF